MGGPDFTWSRVASYAECRTVCQGDPDCARFGFMPDHGQFCARSPVYFEAFLGNPDIIQFGNP